MKKPHDMTLFQLTRAINYITQWVVLWFMFQTYRSTGWTWEIIWGNWISLMVVLILIILTQLFKPKNKS